MVRFALTGGSRAPDSVSYQSRGTEHCWGEVWAAGGGLSGRYVQLFAHSLKDRRPSVVSSCLCRGEPAGWRWEDAEQLLVDVSQCPPSRTVCFAALQPAQVLTPGPVLTILLLLTLTSALHVLSASWFEAKPDTSKYVDRLFSAGRECKLSHLNKANAESSHWSQISLISADEKYSRHLRS